VPPASTAPPKLRIQEQSNEDEYALLPKKDSDGIVFTDVKDI
jgi:hypothetical protein